MTLILIAGIGRRSQPAGHVQQGRVLAAYLKGIRPGESLKRIPLPGDEEDGRNTTNAHLRSTLWLAQPNDMEFSGERSESAALRG